MRHVLLACDRKVPRQRIDTQVGMTQQACSEPQSQGGIIIEQFNDNRIQ